MLLKELKKQILINSYKAGACHIGSALSCAEILRKLYYETLKENDIFLFSKASGVATLYVILADKRYFPKEKVTEYLKNYPLASKEVPGVVHSVGSLGHGLSVACGIAIADRSRRVYVLLSDGECQEGSTYEAVLFAAQHKLDNLYVIIDVNRLQACGITREILDLNTAFEFMESSLINFDYVFTIKGDGIDFMENNYEWHYKNLTKELLDKALKQL